MGSKLVVGIEKVRRLSIDVKVLGYLIKSSSHSNVQSDDVDYPCSTYIYIHVIHINATKHNPNTHNRDIVASGAGRTLDPVRRGLTMVWIDKTNTRKEMSLIVDFERILSRTAEPHGKNLSSDEH